MDTKSYLFEKVYFKFYEGVYEHKDSGIYWSKLWKRYHGISDQVINYYDL